MHTTAIGNRGEDLVSQWLLYNHFYVLERNWKSRWCEIDIIASKDEVVYFVEVKYRKNDKFGGGFDYINNRKVQQMRFSAEFWMKIHNYSGCCQLAAASVDGESGEVDFIDDL